MASWCGKKIFTKREAEHTLEVNLHNGKKYRRERRAYYCKLCNEWHLTSEPDKNENKVVEIGLVYEDQWKKLLNL
jgi:hypothetical protein